jgi:Phage integrase family
MSKNHLYGRISFLMALALAIGSTCTPAQPRPGPPPSTPGGTGGTPGRGEPLLMSPPKPHKPVVVTLPQPYHDRSFEAFRKELKAHPHKVRHACGYALANDTRAIQGWLGHRSITSTVVYTALASNRFKDFWRE